MERPKTIKDVMAITDVPAIVANEQAIVEFINDRFTKEYGWTKKDLIGEPLTTIIPEYFRDTHRVGFARFIATEKATLLGMPMQLAILFKDGSVDDAEHYIIGEKSGDTWRFGATISRTSKGQASSGRKH